MDHFEYWMRFPDGAEHHLLTVGVEDGKPSISITEYAPSPMVMLCQECHFPFGAADRHSEEYPDMEAVADEMGIPIIPLIGAAYYDKQVHGGCVCKENPIAREFLRRLAARPDAQVEHDIGHGWTAGIPDEFRGGGTS